MNPSQVVDEALGLMFEMVNDFVADHDEEGLSIDGHFFYLTEAVGRLSREIRKGDGEQALVHAAAAVAIGFELEKQLIALGWARGEENSSWRA